MKPKPHRTYHLLAAAAAMFAAWLLADRALATMLGSPSARALVAALISSLIGAAVLARLGPSGSWGAISQARDVLRAMRRGDYTGRVPVPERSALAPLAVDLNELAAELSRSRDAAKKQHELLNGILDRMPEGVIVFDREGHVILANLAARRIAVSGEEILGKSAIEALRNATLAEMVSRALTSGRGSAREIEIAGVMPRRLLVRLSERAGEESGGDVIAVLHDVTDLRRLETIRTDFVSNVSHELRTPVTAITTAAETLLSGALDDRDEAGEFVEMIDRNARRLRRLVDDILDLSKIEGKAYKLSPVLLELAPIFAHAKNLVHDAAARRRMKIVVHGGAGAKAWIDRHAFDQVLGNLLDNAVKYAGDGATVTVSARAEGDSTIVRVEDTGAGIPPQHLARLFERFYRVDAGRSREVGGTGLGLSIVKHLVEAMGGTIAVESEIGKGTTFTLVLSRSAPPEKATTTPVVVQDTD
ncbi:MAG: ATP-binding protein [Polyangiaceae bacterium]